MKNAMEMTATVPVTASTLFISLFQSNRLLDSNPYRVSKSTEIIGSLATITPKKRSMRPSKM